MTIDRFNKTECVIIDYGMGNLGSVQNMLLRLGYTAKITSKKNEIDAATKLILPGVGAFDHAMTNLKQQGILDILNYKVLKEKVPILGICLGMQLMTEKSEEGTIPGLGWIEGETRRLYSKEVGVKFRLPHMGWNTIERKQSSNLLGDPDENERFYFVHSYHVYCYQVDNILATSYYGDHFTAAIIQSNIFATQFHPEKSHRFGMKVLLNFMENCHAAN